MTIKEQQILSRRVYSFLWFIRIELLTVSTCRNGLLTPRADVLSFSPLSVAILHFGKLERSTSSASFAKCGKVQNNNGVFTDYTHEEELRIFKYYCRRKTIRWTGVEELKQPILGSAFLSNFPKLDVNSRDPSSTTLTRLFLLPLMSMHDKI